jgi:chemotaxis protein methyltransferase CheR
MNLTGPLPALPPFDVIFLRNVLIYFDVATKEVGAAQRRQAAAAGRLALPRRAETTIGIDDNYERVAAGRTSAYRVRKRGARRAARKG